MKRGLSIGALLLFILVGMLTTGLTQTAQDFPMRTFTPLPPTINLTEIAQSTLIRQASEQTLNAPTPTATPDLTRFALAFTQTAAVFNETRTAQASTSTPTFQPTSSPRMTSTRTIATNTQVSNLQSVGDGQCPFPRLISQLSTSQIAVANDVLRLRSAPDTNAEILDRVRTEELVTLIQGPICSENWLWWQVRTADNQTGWVVEIGRGGEISGGGIYLLLPEGSELGPEANRAD